MVYSPPRAIVEPSYRRIPDIDVPHLAPLLETKPLKPGPGLFFISKIISRSIRDPGLLEIPVYLFTIESNVSLCRNLPFSYSIEWQSEFSTFKWHIRDTNKWHNQFSVQILRFFYAGLPNKNKKSPKSDLFSINCFFNPGLLEIPVYFDLQVLLSQFIRDPGLLEILV